MTKAQFIEAAQKAFEMKHGIRLLGEKPHNPLKPKPHGGLKNVALRSPQTNR